MINYTKSLLFFVVFFAIYTISGFTYQTCSFLKESKIISLEEFLDFPVVNQEEHSMAEALPLYVHQKIPTAVIKEAVDEGLMIEILGVPFPDACFFKEAQFEEINISYERKVGKEENYIRPSYYYKQIGNEKVLAIFAMPGEDYLQQMAALVSYYIKFDLGKKPEDFVKVTLFPLLEKNIGLWTHLDENFVKPNDTVLIGNVSDFFNYLKNEKFILEEFEEFENSYYKVNRIKMGERSVAFLRAKQTFWGNMSGYLTQRILDLGASEIIYMSKIATLDNPLDIYSKIYSPTKFVLLQDNELKVVGNVKNPLVEKFPELNSGTHISLPTVMEQDFRTSALAHSVASSLDLEVANIASIIEKFNQEKNKQVSFVPIHWVTDYLRIKEEANLHTGFDLTNGDSNSGKEKKRKILEKIYPLLKAYLTATEGSLS